MRRRFLQSSKKLDYFTAIPLRDTGATFSVKQFVYPDIDSPNLEIGAPFYYRIDNGEWVEVEKDLYAGMGGNFSIFVPFGSKIQFKANWADYVMVGENIRGYVHSEDMFSIDGSLMSFLYGDLIIREAKIATDLTALPRLCDYNLTSGLYRIENEIDLLPATKLCSKCYSSLFYGCIELINMPLLPADSLASYCYEYMFQHCHNLKNVKHLPATALTPGCYYYMFSSSGIEVVPELPATILSDGCYSYMFANCASLIYAPKLPATELKPYCYEGMFFGCFNLSNTPELPATKMETGCYLNMFDGCGLKKSPILPATKLAPVCYRSMFSGCGFETAPNLPATKLENLCYYGMFSNCHSLTNPPSLPATTLAKDCYGRMFYKCNRLVEAPKLPALSTAENSYKYMFEGCDSLKYINTMFENEEGGSVSFWLNHPRTYGVFARNKNATWNVEKTNIVPTLWTVVDVDPKTDEFEFDINGKMFKSTTDLTWADWIVSDYNSEQSIYVEGNLLIYEDSIIIGKGGNSARLEDKIITNIPFTLTPKS